LKNLLIAAALVAGGPLAWAQPGSTSAGGSTSSRHFDDDIGRRLDSVVQAFGKRGEFSGAVLVGRDGRVIYEGAFGEADRELHVRNTPAMHYRIASMTKQFTAALVLRLVEDGLLQLDSPVSAYLPDYPRPQADRLTLRALLNHSAGLPDYPRLPGFYEREATRGHTPAGLLALFDSLPLAFAPGSQWAYSNSDYIVLGAIIERITGQSYATAIRERLLAPLGLTQTAYDDPDEVVEGRARGYMRDSTRMINAPYIDPSAVYAAGMLRSTVGDIFRWAEQIRAGAVFKTKATADLMFSPQIPTSTPLGDYGFGVFVGKQDLSGRSFLVIQHGGTINGFTSGFWRLPAERAVVVVMDNTMSHSTPALTRALAETLLRSAP
jgi:CubicO group peptidase (beta-lactamase class C family)